MKKFLGDLIVVTEMFFGPLHHHVNFPPIIEGYPFVARRSPVLDPSIVRIAEGLSYASTIEVRGLTLHLEPKTGATGAGEAGLGMPGVRWVTPGNPLVQFPPG